MIAISHPCPPKDTFTKYPFMVYIHDDFMTWKILIHKPIYDACATFLGIIITRVSQVEHQKYFSSRVVKIAAVRRTPQCIAQTNEAINKSFSLPVISLLIKFNLRITIVGHFMRPPLIQLQLLNLMEQEQNSIQYAVDTYKEHYYYEAY